MFYSNTLFCWIVFHIAAYQQRMIFGDGRYGLENPASLCGPKNFCFHANEKWLWPDVSNMKIQNVAADVSDQILKNLWRQRVGTFWLKQGLMLGRQYAVQLPLAFIWLMQLKDFSFLKALAQMHRTYNKFHYKEKKLQLAKQHVLKPTRCSDKSHGTCFSYLKEKVSTLFKFRGFAQRDTQVRNIFQIVHCTSILWAFDTQEVKKRSLASFWVALECRRNLPLWTKSAKCIVAFFSYLPQLHCSWWKLLVLFVFSSVGQTSNK